MQITIQTRGLPDGTHQDKTYHFWVDVQKGFVEIPWNDEEGYARHWEQESWLCALKHPELKPTVFGHFEIIGGTRSLEKFLKLLAPVSLIGREEIEPFLAPGTSEGMKTPPGPGQS